MPPRSTAPTWPGSSPSAPSTWPTNAPWPRGQPPWTCAARSSRWIGMPDRIPISVTVNNRTYTRTVEPRLLLSDFLRHHLRLARRGVRAWRVRRMHGAGRRPTGALVPDAGRPGRSTPASRRSKAWPKKTEAARLHPIQQAFWDSHGLQCGFCTAGLLITTVALLRDNPRPVMTRDSGRAERQPVPLHGLSEHRRAVRLARSGVMAALVPGNEDPRLLRGLGSYVDDIDPPGVLHAAILRSPYGHARIADPSMSPPPALTQACTPSTPQPTWARSTSPRR